MKQLATFTAFAAMMLIFAGCAEYVLDVNAEPDPISAGGAGKIEVSFEAKGKYYIEPEGMVRINFNPPEGITIKKSDMTQEDRGENGAFSTAFTVAGDSKPGPAEIQSDITFQICTEKLCKLVNEQRTITLNIRP